MNFAIILICESEQRSCGASILNTIYFFKNTILLICFFLLDGVKKLSVGSGVAGPQIVRGRFLSKLIWVHCGFEKILWYIWKL